MAAISRNALGVPDPPEDLHGPPHDHPYLPVYLPEDSPVTVLHRAAGIEDPRVRATELTRHLSYAQQWVTWGSRQRDVAVLQMRAAGASYDDVARTLGVSKSRAQQLCRRLGEQHPGGASSWEKQAHSPGGTVLLEDEPDPAGERTDEDGQPVLA